MLRAEAEQVHAIVKLEIAAANAELENKIKREILTIMKVELAKVFPKKESVAQKQEKSKEVKKNT